MQTRSQRTCISISLPGDLARLLRQAAADDNRSVSSLLASLSQGYLKREGYLSAIEKPGRAPRQTRLDL